MVHTSYFQGFMSLRNVTASHDFETSSGLDSHKIRKILGITGRAALSSDRLKEVSNPGPLNPLK